MDKNKPIIWSLKEDYKDKYVAGFDDYKPSEPLNFWHKIKKKLGLKYKQKEREGSFTICKLENVDGKLIASYKTHEQ